MCLVSYILDLTADLPIDGARNLNDFIRSLEKDAKRTGLFPGIKEVCDVIRNTKGPFADIVSILITIEPTSQEKFKSNLNILDNFLRNLVELNDRKDSKNANVIIASIKEVFAASMNRAFSA